MYSRPLVSATEPCQDHGSRARRHTLSTCSPLVQVPDDTCHAGSPCGRASCVGSDTECFHALPTATTTTASQGQAASTRHWTEARRIGTQDTSTNWKSPGGSRVITRPGRELDVFPDVSVRAQGCWGHTWHGQDCPGESLKEELLQRVPRGSPRGVQGRSDPARPRTVSRATPACCLGPTSLVPTALGRVHSPRGRTVRPRGPKWTPCSLLIPQAPSAWEQEARTVHGAHSGQLAVSPHMALHPLTSGLPVPGDSPQG